MVEFSRSAFRMEATLISTENIPYSHVCAITYIFADENYIQKHCSYHGDNKFLENVQNERCARNTGAKILMRKCALTTF